MNESNGDVVRRDEENAERLSTRDSMLLAEIGQLERMIEKKEEEISELQDEVDNASDRLADAQIELSSLQESLSDKNHLLENPESEDEEYDDQE